MSKTKKIGQKEKRSKEAPKKRKAKKLDWSEAKRRMADLRKQYFSAEKKKKAAQKELDRVMEKTKALQKRCPHTTVEVVTQHLDAGDGVRKDEVCVNCRKYLAWLPSQ